LYRFTTWDSLTNIDLASLDCVDLGNLPVVSDVAKGQAQLGNVLGELLKDQAVPIVLGGGHETAFGHYLGYAAANLACGIINFDAHLDVRPFPNGPHSGSSFRQAMEYAPFPLKPGRYVVIGAQRQCVAQAHAQWVQKQQGRIYWLEEVSSRQKTTQVFEEELQRLGKECARIMVSVDADVFRQADVPGTSAPSPMGLQGSLFSEIALKAGSHSQVGSMEIVEINPQYDRDNQSVCWAALGIRQFLIGLASRFGKMAEKKEN
jgi:formiminoglutamase